MAAEGTVFPDQGGKMNEGNMQNSLKAVTALNRKQCVKQL